MASRRCYQTRAAPAEAGMDREQGSERVCRARRMVEHAGGRRRHRRAERGDGSGERPAALLGPGGVPGARSRRDYAAA